MARSWARGLAVVSRRMCVLRAGGGAGGGATFRGAGRAGQLDSQAAMAMAKQTHTRAHAGQPTMLTAGDTGLPGQARLSPEAI